MPRFFFSFSPSCGESVALAGEDGRHIARSLRMQAGESLTLCNGEGMDFLCEITAVTGEEAVVVVKQTQPSQGEPSLWVTVYQALPKLDKMDSIAQKIVEAGASQLVPVLTSRCISRPDEKAAHKKQERWHKIAEEAAKQCGRGRIPQVSPLQPFARAIEQAAQEGEVILFYEGGGQSLADLVGKDSRQISIFIGPEGGFSPEEVALAKQHGARIGSLGPRIFRTETAPVAALAAMMLASGNLEGGGSP